MVSALGNGVIGNTAVSGTVIQGSSPCSPTKSSVSSFEGLRSAGVFFLLGLMYRNASGKGLTSPIFLLVDAWAIS